ncbi:sulfotransferase family protein [Oceaniglobus ichthyenteri]|uniref:sulfotransferase-like domain-containing protein n=1 Tax=Oceaniglobus ichthyenteri TaxID=2136177 RepID=UPI000D3A5C93|nr:sulfotransferase family protein [Oceaniglobus ichthyenteri]
MRICMWSGPRNLSTAMMYSFGARSDCDVVDEPFYGAFLARSGLEHPMRDAILAAEPTDPAQVGAALTAPLGARHMYQKHMVHHMMPGFMPDWPADTRHVFLIRHPARVVASYAKKREAPTIEDLGFAHQLNLYQGFVKSGAAPIVIDSGDIRANPGAALAALCAALTLPFDPAMLNWPAGGHPSDGVWAAHWYGAVHRSTGFDGAEGALPHLDGQYGELADAGMAAYQHLYAARIKISKL